MKKTINENKFVSIIIPVFNSEKYVENVYNNVMCQTYKNYEIIFVVDQRTTDNTLSILHKINDEKIKIIIQEDDSRLGGAKNLGIDSSIGDVVWFLDADDYAYPSFLEEMISIMNEYDADIVFCNHFHSLNRKIPMIPEREYDVTTYTSTEALKKINQLPMYSWSKIQKKKILEHDESKFKKYFSIEDVEQTICSLAISEKVCFYSKPLYVYFKSNQTSSKKNRLYEAADIVKITKNTLAVIQNKKPESYNEFKIHISEIMMRQMAHSNYSAFSKIYKEEFVQHLINSINEKTTEMKVFLRSKLAYYIILYPFTHYIWDKKKGLWRNV